MRVRNPQQPAHDRRLDMGEACLEEVPVTILISNVPAAVRCDHHSSRQPLVGRENRLDRDEAAGPGQQRSNELAQVDHIG